MSGTRLVKAVKDNQKEIAAVSLKTSAAYATQVVATETVKHHAPALWNTLNAFAQDYFVPATGLVGSVVVNGTFNVLTNIATGAEWTWKQAGLDVATRTASAFAVQAAYNGINQLAGRDISEITLLERAGVDTAVNAAANRALHAVPAAARFLAEKAPKFGSLFNRQPQVNDPNVYANLLNANGLNVESQEPVAPAPTPTSPRR